MKDYEYINVSDRARISDAKNILKEIIPESSPIIDKESHQNIMRILTDWEEKLFNIHVIEE